MLLACSNMTPPDSWSTSGACHPPYVKPLSRSSSGPPGACATPSSVTNSVTMSLPMVSSFAWCDASLCRRHRRADVIAGAAINGPGGGHDAGLGWMDSSALGRRLPRRRVVGQPRKQAAGALHRPGAGELVARHRSTEHRVGGNRSAPIARCLRTSPSDRQRNDAARHRQFWHALGASYAGFCQTETWLRLLLVKGSRFQSLHRSRKAIPARRAMRSNSDGHTLRNGAEKVLVSPPTNQ
jgi:hypothetical protein